MSLCSIRGTSSGKRILLKLIMITAALLGAVQCEAETLTGRVSVIDGDTLDMRGLRIRLFGMDAPEAGQTCQSRDGAPWRCGTYAARKLDELIGGKVVICEQRDTDRYGRLVATCAAGTLDLGRAMVESGHAVAFRKYSNIYVPDEEGARVSRRGIWDGSFQMPDDWRRTHRP